MRKIDPIEFKYDLKADEVKRAMRFFDRKTKFYGRVAFTVLLAFVAGVYAYDLFFRTDHGMSASFCVFIIGVSLGVIAVMWLNVNNRWKNLAKAAAEGGEFAVKIDDKEIATWTLDRTGNEIEDSTKPYEPYQMDKTDEPDEPYESHKPDEAQEQAEVYENESDDHSNPNPDITWLDFEDGEMVIYLLEGMFVVIMNREWIYIFPHRCIGEEQTEKMEMLFKEKLNNRYIEGEKKK